MHPSRNQRKLQGLPIQLKYAMFLTLVVGFTALVTIFVMAWFIQRNYNLFMGDELGVSTQVIQMVRREQRLLEVSLFFLFVISVTVTFLSSLYVTRKLTGPILALQRQLWLYSRGDWTRDFRLRQKDEFREFEAIVNQIRQNHLSLNKPETRDSLGMRS